MQAARLVALRWLCDHGADMNARDQVSDESEVELLMACAVVCSTREGIANSHPDVVLFDSW